MPCYDDITRLLGIVSSMREPFNHHGSHVAGSAMNLARAAGLSEADVELIRIGSHLHDVGKLLVRSEVLNAPRKLTNAERAEMETHTMLGWAIVNEAGYAMVIQDIVRHHHENWDGSGYPDGLKAHEIPVAAQVAAIPDVYEALTRQRPYREAYSHQFAMAMIQKDIGTRFNRQLVDLFFAKVATHG